MSDTDAVDVSPERHQADPAMQQEGSGGERRSRWQALVDVLTVAGTLVVGLYGLGGVLVALRLNALKLPVDAAVAALPKNALLVASVRALGPGLLAGAAIWWLTRSRLRLAVRAAPLKPPPSRVIREGALLAVGLAAVVVVFFLLERPVKFERVAASALVLVALLIGCVLLIRTNRLLRPRSDLALVMIGLALALSIANEAIPPTHLDYVTVRLKTGGVTDGYYLASDANSLYLAPNVLDRTVGDIAVIPRGEIKSFKVERYEEQARLAYKWKEEKQEPFRERQDKDEQERITKVRVYAMLTGIRIDPVWVYPPVIPYASGRFLLQRSQRDFIDGAPHSWKEGISRAEPVALGDVLLDPTLYIEKVIRTHGQVTRVTDTASRRRLVVVRPHQSDKSGEAYCQYVPAADGVRSGTRVRLRAVVVGWGTVQTHGGKPANVIALTCAHVSAVPRGNKRG